jgi:hypothetical protein
MECMHAGLCSEADCVHVCMSNRSRCTQTALNATCLLAPIQSPAFLFSKPPDPFPFKFDREKKLKVKEVYVCKMTGGMTQPI